IGNVVNNILPGIYIDNFEDIKVAEYLSKDKVIPIFSIHNGTRPMLKGIKYLCIPAADSLPQNLRRYFKESIGFIHEMTQLQEGCCLVHSVLL
uniref:Uncharacterized protein n=1 Tax=Sarcophilus harrisii TaxID=9305 RepID=A0A7N4V600_SARHA